MSDHYILEIKNLKKSFGGIKATNDLSLNVKNNQLKGIIGPNGAGKTTLFNLISGYYKPDDGKILFQNNNIANIKPDKIVNKGIGRTFQKIRVMKNIKVLDYIKTALFSNIKYSIVDILFNTSKYINEEKKAEEKVLSLMNDFEIANLKNKKMEELSYGEQRRASICRALALNPTLLLLDEPTAGLNRGETDIIKELIMEIKNKFDLTVLIVEHDMKIIMSMCEQIAVVNQGKILVEGNPIEIQNNEEVIKTYLGE